MQLAQCEPARSGRRRLHDCSPRPMRHREWRGDGWFGALGRPGIADRPGGVGRVALPQRKDAAIVSQRGTRGKGTRGDHATLLEVGSLADDARSGVAESTTGTWAG